MHTKVDEYAVKDYPLSVFWVSTYKMMLMFKQKTLQDVCKATYNQKFINQLI